MARDDFDRVAEDLAEAIAYSKLGQKEEALRRATALLRRAPNDHLTWRFKGEMLFELARYAEAAGCLRRSAELTGALTGDIYIWLACALSNAGRRDEAIADLELALFNAGGQDHAFREKASRCLRDIRADYRRYGSRRPEVHDGY
jgi:tetratricopeptide (TPR) repeat protein